MKINDIYKNTRFYKKQIIKKCLEREYERLLDKAENIDSKFHRNFFLQIVNCCKADISELYMDLLYNRSRSKNVDICMETINELYEWIAFYHTTKFLHETEHGISNNDLYNELFVLFSFKPEKMSEINQLIDLYKDCESIFDVEYALMILDIIHMQDIQSAHKSTVMQAYINNFIYNSYKSFQSSFVRFSSLNGAVYGMNI